MLKSVYKVKNKFFSQADMTCPQKESESIEEVKNIEKIETENQISSKNDHVESRLKIESFETKSQDNERDLSAVAEELVPNLESFDPTILDLLPKKLQTFVNERIKLLNSKKMLRVDKVNFSSNDMIGQIEKTDVSCIYFW